MQFPCYRPSQIRQVCPPQVSHILLRTMHYALNSNVNMLVEKTEIEKVLIKKVDIKKGKRMVVEGLSKVKETEQKKSVAGF